MDKEDSNNRSEAHGGKDESMEKFAAFSVDDWQEWLYSFLNSRPCHPHISSGYDYPHRVLQGLYNSLGHTSEPGLRFSEAIASMYESIQYTQENAGMIYNLLRVIAYAKPTRARRLLTRDILNEILLRSHPPGIQYKGLDLHVLLLAARGEYEIDETIIDYIFSSTERIKDPSYLRLAFRMLASSGGQTAFTLLDRVIANFSKDRLEMEADAQEIALEVGVEVHRRAAARPFFFWYSNHARDLAEKYPVQLAEFERALRADVLPLDKALADTDKLYIRLLGLQLFAHERTYTPQSWVDVARAHRQVGVETTTNVILNMCKKAYPDWSKEPPFRFVYENFHFKDKQKQDNTAFIVMNASAPAKFDGKEEPDLARVFNNVFSEFNLAYKPIARAASARQQVRPDVD